MTKTFSRKQVVVVVGSAVFAGVLVGTGSLALAANTGASPKVSSASETGRQDVPAGDPKAEPTEPFPTNESGQTYGTFKVGETQPDLVPGATDDGQPGYIYVSDLEWAPAKDPDDAVRIMKERVNDDGKIVVPVYEVDGKTKIGSFTAGQVDPPDDESGE